MSAFLGACGGFLLAVLWFDLMFDVQVLRRPRTAGELPEDVLASIAGYYRRVTSEARPMNLLVAAVMLMAVGGSVTQLLLGRDPRWMAGASVALCGGPILLARLRVVGNAVRLGARRDSAAMQSELARGIFRDHLVCIAAIGVFVTLQVSSAMW